MTPEQEIQQLRDTIAYHADLYYNHDAPVISDFEYDALMRRLRALEAAHPELLVPGSPTEGGRRAVEAVCPGASRRPA